VAGEAGGAAPRLYKHWGAMPRVLSCGTVLVCV